MATPKAKSPTGLAARTWRRIATRSPDTNTWLGSAFAPSRSTAVISTSREPHRPSLARERSSGTSDGWWRGQACGGARVGDLQRAILGGGDVHEIGIDHPLGIALGANDTGIQPQRLVTESRDQIERMRDQQHGAAAAA